MSSQKKQRFNDYFELGLYFISTGCLIYFLIQGIPLKALQGILIISVLTIIRGVVKFTKTELFPALRFSILFFIFLTMLLANEFGFYGIIPNLDKIEHLLSGVILHFIGMLIYWKLTAAEGNQRNVSSTAIWFGFFFSVAMAGFWEMYEFTTDYLFGFQSQRGSLTDTMGDIICGTIGAVGTSIYLAFKGKRENPSPSTT
ncbi:hypothetical protein OB236_13705 [Paenibacillus sp. WQ 127069]|uniref:DUF2238 domain-containing protein n=1 Tax=Paenibacillus baimaensis TaxID=2982185 RepID=A0ABT2UEV0_9BACL|nr:hypothetical protein [Paenibacillus sp. WQ 127069]MCU6793173.1 hypothetical protein [Paenibacillus sp. WQ 127069]